MKFFKYLVLALIIALPVNVFGQAFVQSNVDFMQTDKDDEEVYAYYDLRNRKTYIQVTANNQNPRPDRTFPVCVHIQIFQQDQGCTELDFEDRLTANDTVIYDMDDLRRNDGSEVPVNLNDDSYGYVAISAYECNDRSVEDPYKILIGNVRIIDDAGYEYRMNLVTDDSSENLIEGGPPTPGGDVADVIIPFNTVDGAKYADVVGFLVEDDRTISGLDNIPGGQEDQVYNEKTGITFSVFQFDENEEPISCDQKTFGCGPDVVLNYGINEDYPASRGNNLLCEGAGLSPGQTNGYISLENASALSPLDNRPDPEDDSFEFVCLVGLNNGDGTGSMDECRFRCEGGGDNCGGG